MQFEIQFDAVDDYALVHDYYYDLGIALLKVLETQNKSLVEKLHDGDFYSRIKLFVFSPLHSEPKPQMITMQNGSNGFILGSKVWMRFGSARPEIIYTLGDALLSKGIINIRGKQLKISKIEMVKPPVFHETMIYKPFGRVGSICCRFGKDQRTYFQYPDNRIKEIPKFEELIEANLRHKCLRLKEIRKDIYENLLSASEITDADIKTIPINIECLKFSDERPFLESLRYIKDQPVRAFNVPIKVQAPEIIHRIIWDCGLGAMNSQGFGLIVSENRRK